MNIQKQIIEIISEQLNIQSEEIKIENEFVKDLKADSLDLVELIMSFEEKFELQIPDEQAEKMQKVKDIIDYITSNKS